MFVSPTSVQTCRVGELISQPNAPSLAFPQQCPVKATLSLAEVGNQMTRNYGGNDDLKSNWIQSKRNRSAQDRFLGRLTHSTSLWTTREKEGVRARIFLFKEV